MTSTDPDTKKYLKQIALASRWDQVVIRGCITGMFSAIGILLGTAIVVFIGTRLLGGLREIPLVSTILEQTKLDVLIEQQVNKLSAEGGATTPPASTPSSEPTFATYESDTLGVRVKYPSYLTATTDNTSAVGTLTLISNAGALASLEITNKQTEVFGYSVQRFISHKQIGAVTIEVFEQSATVNTDRKINNPAFFTKVSNNGKTLYILGIADPGNAKLGRETYTNIIESLEFK